MRKYILVLAIAVVGSFSSLAVDMATGTVHLTGAKVQTDGLIKGKVDKTNTEEAEVGQVAVVDCGDDFNLPIPCEILVVKGVHSGADGGSGGNPSTDPTAYRRLLADTGHELECECIDKEDKKKKDAS